jgi:hypothetical protein
MRRERRWHAAAAASFPAALLSAVPTDVPAEAL